MLEGKTLAGLRDEYEQVARRTDELVATLPDLDISHSAGRLGRQPLNRRGPDGTAPSLVHTAVDALLGVQL